MNLEERSETSVSNSRPCSTLSAEGRESSIMDIMANDTGSPRIDGEWWRGMPPSVIVRVKAESSHVALNEGLMPS